jgi:hypothetical protein
MSKSLRRLKPVINFSERHACKTFPGRSQIRQLLTAATLNSPSPSSKTHKYKQSSILPDLVDATISWAAKDYKSSDPPSHAVVLIGRDLLSRDTKEFLESLSAAKQLRTLNAVIGVVDKVGVDANGVSVLLASSDEGVTFETAKGTETELLRVGRWHAKDQEAEDDEPLDFRNIMASIRKGTQITAVDGSGKEAIGSEFVFALGEADGLQRQAMEINQLFPTADIV